GSGNLYLGSIANGIENSHASVYYTGTGLGMGNNKQIEMQKTVVLNIVGLSSSIIGKYTPFLKEYSERRNLRKIKPMLPAVTTAVQSTYLTGTWPSDHGIVGNGWYDRMDNEVKFWKQSNKLVLRENIWDKAKREDPTFTVSQLFWWYKDRKSTRLNSSHVKISYAVFCLKK